MSQEAVARAAAALREANYVLVLAGAGMSADAPTSLPVYNDIANIEPYKSLGIDYMGISQPRMLLKDPELFLGFWGVCYNSYAAATPHPGYHILLKWKNEALRAHLATDLPSFFIYTSNVDSLFEKAGFQASEIHELHGCSKVLQCSVPCGNHTWKLPEQFRYKVDPITRKALDEDTPQGPNHPKCPKCGALARANVLMFGDREYVRPPGSHKPYSDLRKNLVQRLQKDPSKKLVLIECGAGLKVPSLRNQAEEYLQNCPGATLIRINRDFSDLDSKDPELQSRFISIKSGACPALEAIDQLLQPAQI